MFIRNTPEIIEDNTIKTYACGSLNLKNFLVLNNIIPIYRYIHNLSQKTIWIFVQCDDLSKLLTIWADNNPHLRGGENDNG